MSKFKVGDKVRCIDGYALITVGEIYTVTKVETHEWAEFVWLKEACPSDYFNVKRFELVSNAPLKGDLMTGITYGILYDRIRDTDEDLWIVAETIAEALGEVEDKL